MFEIAIAEDVEEQALLLKQKIESDAGFQGECRIRVYLHPAWLLGDMRDGRRFDICFLDVSMPQMDGLQLAAKIREYDSRVILVFLTSHPEFAISGYQVRAFDYILKQDLDRRWPAVSARLLEEAGRLEKDVYWIRMPHGRSECVSLEEILYIRKEGNNITFHLNGRADVPTVRGAMSSICGEFSRYEQFVRIQRGILINAHRVVGTDAKGFVMSDGTYLNLGRDYMEHARKELLRQTRSGGKD